MRYQRNKNKSNKTGRRTNNSNV